MPLEGEYLGMHLLVSDIDIEQHAFFEHCGRHDFRLQRWASNGLLSYPPSTACPWDGTNEYDWVSVDARGTVASYCEVHHPILAAYAEHVPYMTLLVELDAQRGEPTEHEALRLFGNLVTDDGSLATTELIATVGIGSRVRMVYVDVGDGFALPQWALDARTPQPDAPWRYPAG